MSQTRNPKSIVAVAAFAAFLATFNETFLNVGFAPIMADLAVDVATVQWLATAYMLGAAVMVPVSAFAYRSFRTRPLFCLTCSFLVVGSVIGALAPNFWVLLVGRIVQALGTGMLIPIGMNITLEVAPREKLGTYMGIMGAMTTLGPSSSVILAGIILAFFSWHMLLWVFAALSALCLIAGAIFLHDIAHLTHPRMDALSVALIGIALVGILYGVSTAFTASLVLALGAVVVGALALVLFVRRQKQLDEPLIDLRPLSVAPFAVGTIANMVSLLTIFAMNIIVPTFMQSVLGTEPLIASLTLFPAILCSCAVSPLAGRIYDKHGAAILLPVGFACIAVFSVLVALFIATASPIVLAILYVPVICGSALIIGPVQSFALSKLAPEQNPHGVTIMSTGFQIAGCVGSSVFTGVYAAVMAGGMAAGQTTADAATAGMLGAGVLVGVVALVGFALSFYIRRVERAGAGAAAAAAAAAAGTAGVAGAEAGAGAGAGATSGKATPFGEAGALASLMKTDVFAVSPTTTVGEAMKLFAAKGISGAPVVDDARRIVGFISDGDIMASMADQVPAFKTAWSFVVERGNADFDATLRQVMKQPVSAIATRDVISVNISDDLGEVARVLAERHLKKAPVLEGGRMVGIINRSNITHYAIRRFAEE